MKTYDLIVIGSGPAGHHAAIQAAKIGKRVALVEKRELMGGVSVHTGTIPSKTLREAVLYLSGFRQRGLYGISYAVKKDITIEDLVFRVNHVIKTESEVCNAQLSRNGVDVLIGHASFLDAHHLHVEGSRLVADFETEFIIIATGTVPSHSSAVPIDGTTILDSDMLPRLPAIPKTMTVIGAGVVGIEYACMMATLGVAITLLDLRPRMLEFVDEQIINELTYHMREIGVTLRLGEEMESVDKTASGRVVVQLKSKKEIYSDVVLYAVGRLGNTSDLHLEKAGFLPDDRGRITVNESYQTPVPNIYAVGDVIGFPSLASASMEQGRLASCHAFHLPCSSMPHLFPYGIYTIPEISFVGQNEEQLTTAGIPYEVGVARYREIARGQIIGDETGILKLLFHCGSRKLLGVHILGEGAGELIHIGQAVLTYEGTIDYFINNVFNYPTLAECYKVAAFSGMNKLLAR
ncbi:MAG: Si-specific NAD(P)(+) transhydrogenase [Acidobacteriia bacterium]|nr:Si-specific NAD(P)(+) transhydrogenase [Terriglobia bacterium]